MDSAWLTLPSEAPFGARYMMPKRGWGVLDKRRKEGREDTLTKYNLVHFENVGYKIHRDGPIEVFLRSRNQWANRIVGPKRNAPLEQKDTKVRRPPPRA